MENEDKAMNNTSSELTLENVSGIWKKRLRLGGSSSSMQKSFMQPLLNLIITPSGFRSDADKRYSIKELIKKFSSQLGMIFQSPGVALLGLGLTLDEINTIETLSGVDVYSAKLDVVGCLIFPDLLEIDDPEERKSKLLSKLKKFFLTTSYGPDILATLSGI